jgi:conjugal transfer/type IV secretion protein DotA/TraY
MDSQGYLGQRVGYCRGLLGDRVQAPYLRRLFKALFFTSFFVLQTSVFADIDSSGSPFQQVPTDLSLQYLRSIFGTVGNALEAPYATVLGEMFRFFNIGIFWFAISFLGYQTSASVVSASQSGMPFFKKMNFFTTFRLGAGLGLLVPKWSGYAMIQVFIMAAAVQGVHLANKLWYVAIDHTVNSGKIYSSFSIESSLNLMSAVQKINGDKKYNALLNAALCLSAVSESRRAEVNLGGFGVQAREEKMLENSSLGVYFGPEHCKMQANQQAGNTNYLCMGSSTHPQICGLFSWAGGHPNQTVIMHALIPSAIETLRSQITLTLAKMIDISLNKEGTASDLTVDQVAHACTLDSPSAGQQAVCVRNVSALALFLGKYVLDIKSRLLRLASKPSSTAAADEPVWARNAKSSGWIMAATFMKDLAGGYTASSAPTEAQDVKVNAVIQAMSGPSILNFLPQQVDQLSSSGPLQLSPVVANNYSALQRLYAASGQLRRNALSMVKQIFPSHAASGGVTSQWDQSVAANELDQLAYSMLNEWVGKPNASASKRTDGGLYMLTDSSVSDPYHTGRNKPTLDFVYMIQKTLTQLTGFSLYSGTINGISYDPSLCETVCLSSSSLGCMAEAVHAGCIKKGIGILGSYAATVFDGVHINPMRWLVNLGQTMTVSSVTYVMDTTQHIYALLKNWAETYSLIYLALSAVSGLLTLANWTGISQSIVGIATLAVQFSYQFDRYVLTVFLPFGQSISIFLFVTGMMLGVYVPFIPIIMYLFAVLGWFMVVIEGMIAAPIIAIGMAHPEGQDFVGKAEMATMLLFSLFIRPAAILLGYFAALTLMFAAMNYVTKGYVFMFLDLFMSSEVMKNMFIVQFFVLVGGMFMFVWTVLAITTQCFSLIYLVPDRIMKWIGMQPEDSGGGKDALSKAKGGLDTGSQGMGGAGGQAPSQTAKSGMQAQQMSSNYEETSKANEKSSGGGASGGGSGG